MNQIKKLDPSKSKAKVLWWRNLIVGVFFVIIGICSYGCSKDCINDDDTSSNVQDEYYVKYEVSSWTIYMGGKLDLKLTSETNETLSFIINQRTDWETVIGPVQKGFTASLQVNAIDETFDRLTLNTNIYVSKNDSPFAIKKSDGSDVPRNSVVISYTIDY